MCVQVTPFITIQQPYHPVPVFFILSIALSGTLKCTSFDVLCNFFLFDNSSILWISLLHPLIFCFPYVLLTLILILISETICVEGLRSSLRDWKQGVHLTYFWFWFWLVRAFVVAFWLIYFLIALGKFDDDPKPLSISCNHWRIVHCLSFVILCCSICHSNSFLY